MITVIAIVGLILTFCIFSLFMLYRSQEEELQEIVSELRGEISYLKSKNKILERKIQRMSEPSDKIEIIHRYDDEDAPRFGGF